MKKEHKDIGFPLVLILIALVLGVFISELAGMLFLGLGLGYALAKTGDYI